MDFVNPSFAQVFGAWVGASGRGFASLASDEPVGRYPTIHHHPETKPLPPKEGATPKTPQRKNPPKRREGGHIGGSWTINPAYGLIPHLHPRTGICKFKE